MQALSLQSKVDIYLEFLAKSRNRRWFGTGYADQLVRQILRHPNHSHREDFVFYFVFFAYHKMLPPMDESQLYYPLWYFEYRDSVARSLGLNVDGQPWADFNTSFNIFPYRLQSAMTICAVRAASRPLISSEEVQNQFYYLWCALRFKMAYWQSDHTLRVLLNEIEKEKEANPDKVVKCHYEAPLFTLDHKNCLAPPLQST